MRSSRPHRHRPTILMPWLIWYSSAPRVNDTSPSRTLMSRVSCSRRTSNCVPISVAVPRAVRTSTPGSRAISRADVDRARVERDRPFRVQSHHRVVVEPQRLSAGQAQRRAVVSPRPHQRSVGDDRSGVVRPEERNRRARGCDFESAVCHDQGDGVGFDGKVTAMQTGHDDYGENHGGGHRQTPGPQTPALTGRHRDLVLPRCPDGRLDAVGAAVRDLGAGAGRRQQPFHQPGVRGIPPAEPGRCRRGALSLS